MSAQTPCQETPEAWVSDFIDTRRSAAKECARCPLDMFTACQRLAKDAPFGVMAGVDYGVNDRAPKVPKPTLADDVKECEACQATIRRGRRGAGDWEKLRFCSKKCYGTTLVVHGVPDSKVCEGCGDTFTRGSRQPAQWLGLRFCGMTCAAKARRGKKRAA
jgi:hypothetical protein